MSDQAEDKAAEKEKQPGNKKVVIIAAVIVLLVIAVAAAVVAYVISAGKKADTTANQVGGKGVVITKDSHYSTQQMQQDIAAGMIVVKMTGEWNFENGSAAGDGYVANSTHNKKPLKITVREAETGDVLLETDPIPVGSCVENFKLAKDLPKGDYAAVVTHAVIGDDGSVENQVQTEITIHVLN